MAGSSSGDGAEADDGICSSEAGYPITVTGSITPSRLRHREQIREIKPKKQNVSGRYSSACMNAKYIIEEALVEAFPNPVAKTTLTKLAHVGPRQVWAILKELSEKQERLLREEEHGVAYDSLPDLPLWLDEMSLPLSVATKSLVTFQCMRSGVLMTVLRGTHKKPLKLLPLELTKGAIVCADFTEGSAKRLEPLLLSEITAFAKFERFQGDLRGVRQFLGHDVG